VTFVIFLQVFALLGLQSNSAFIRMFNFQSVLHIDFTQG